MFVNGNENRPATTTVRAELVGAAQLADINNANVSPSVSCMKFKGNRSDAMQYNKDIDSANATAVILTRQVSGTVRLNRKK